MKRKNITSSSFPSGRGVQDGLQRESRRYDTGFAGFTLVELIVVITILVILGTIAFVSLGGFSGSARDSSRVSDSATISKGLNISFVKNGTYPDPTAWTGITYSGSIVWKQGAIGDSVISMISGGGVKISKKPVDPLSGVEYTYSITAETKEYSIKTDYEGDKVGYSPVISQKASAATGNPQIAYIAGNYNGVAAKVTTGTTPRVVYLIAVPNIVTTSAYTGVMVGTGQNFITNGSATGGIVFTPKILYSSGALPSNDTERVAFASGIINAYSGTILASQSTVVQFIANVNNTGSLASLAGNVVSMTFGGGVGTAITTTSLTTPINATCGQNATTYASASGAWLGSAAGDFCTTANSTLSGGINPVFPVMGANVSWMCNSTSGGSSASCTATRSLPGAPPSPTAGTHVAAANNITWNWNAVSGATGYKWSTGNNYVGATDIGSSTSYNQTGLSVSTAYTLYVWAYNAGGNSSATVLSATTSASNITCAGTNVTQILSGTPGQSKCVFTGGGSNQSFSIVSNVTVTIYAWGGGGSGNGNGGLGGGAAAGVASVAGSPGDTIKVFVSGTAGGGLGGGGTVVIKQGSSLPTLVTGGGGAGWNSDGGPGQSSTTGQNGFCADAGVGGTSGNGGTAGGGSGGSGGGGFYGNGIASPAWGGGGNGYSGTAGPSGGQFGGGGGWSGGGGCGYPCGGGGGGSYCNPSNTSCQLYAGSGVNPGNSGSPALSGYSNIGAGGMSGGPTVGPGLVVIYW